MIKETPSLGRVAAMVLFSLSCIGLLMFLWLTFGGSIPLEAKGYRFKVAIPEAATLAQEADVRIAGVNVGKVKSKSLEPGARRTLVEIELKSNFAPIPKDSRAVLRQKTLFGESYVELAPGHRAAGLLPDGGTLASSHVEPTVQLDEIFNAFDRPTREAFRQWVAELARASRRSPGRPTPERLNDALGNLEPTAVDGSTLFEVLDEQGLAVRRLVRNTGAVFGALGQREGALRQLIVNANRTFSATASRDQALAQTFAVFPTFLDESRATLARLERFSRSTRPLVRDLRRPADDLRPTVHDLGELSPDLKALFRDLNPLIDASEQGLPDAARIFRGAEPVVEALHGAFAELNPILAYLSFNQQVIGGFLSDGSSNLAAGTSPTTPYSVQNGIIDGRSFEEHASRPGYDRGNAYIAPNVYARASGLGTIESFTCPGGKEIPDPVDTRPPGGEEAAPPCFVQPPSLFAGQQFPRLVKGKAPIEPAPSGRQGSRPAAVH